MCIRKRCKKSREWSRADKKEEKEKKKARGDIEQQHRLLYLKNRFQYFLNFDLKKELAKHEEMLDAEKKQLLQQWLEKWNQDSVGSKKALISDLVHDTYQYVQIKAEQNKRLNFRMKRAYLIAVLAMIIVYGFLFLRNLKEKEGAAEVLSGLLDNAVVLGVLITTAVLIAKWIDVRKYQETWNRHRKHQFLLEQEMLLYLYEQDPYRTGDKEQIFVLRFLSIESGNMSLFHANMQDREKGLTDILEHLKKSN